MYQMPKGLLHVVTEYFDAHTYDYMRSQTWRVRTEISSCEHHSPAFLPGTGLTPGLGFDKGDGRVEGVPGDAAGDFGNELPGVDLALGAKDSSSIIIEMSSVEAFKSVIACCVRVHDGKKMLGYGAARDGFVWFTVLPLLPFPPVSLNPPTHKGSNAGAPRLPRSSCPSFFRSSFRARLCYVLLCARQLVVHSYDVSLYMPAFQSTDHADVNLKFISLG